MGQAKQQKKASGARTRTAGVAWPFTLAANLKRSIRRHFTALGFTKASDGALVLPGAGKEVVRAVHSEQRSERLNHSAAFLARAVPKALPFFANGAEIDPSKIKLRLKRVHSGTVEADLFRVASLTWSVPVSVGFGRRLRYLVWDAHHERLVGLIALGDPVFNLSVRDDLIGWGVHDRAKRLVSVLDAYVLGAVPPYNMLLCGKAVACLVRSQEVFSDFKKSYGGTVGIISGKAKRAKLLAVTTTSSMGRSSIYNRLRLANQRYFEPIGYTIGWGHFHIPDHLFEQIRKFLRAKRDRYAKNHKFGQGPNWRLRAIRRALHVLGMNQAILRHGIKREVFICSFGSNAMEILKTGKGALDTTSLQTVEQISDLARERWIIPRAARMPDYRLWKRESILDLIHGRASTAPKVKSSLNRGAATGG